MVATELRNYNCIRNIRYINTPSLLEEFVLLHMALSSITLSNQPNEIWWRWTPNGQYSAASAYECQFKGAMVFFPTTEVRIEPKCKFFVWLMLHNKILLTDNMAKKNWECNPTCALCYYMPEMIDHLVTKCNYSEALWPQT
jgi:hypothetical protein